MARLCVLEIILLQAQKDPNDAKLVTRHYNLKEEGHALIIGYKPVCHPSRWEGHGGILGGSRMR